jgi:hypothetical protein
MAIIYIGIALVLVITLMTMVLRWRLRSLANMRSEYDFASFCADFGGEEIDPKVLEAVYHRLEDLCRWAIGSFPPRPEDHLGFVFGLANEDLEELIGLILEDTGSEVLSLNGRSQAQVFQLRTVRDVVYYVSRLIKR